MNFKLRDWLFARQRYWGEPIPVIFLDDTGETVPLLETELPITLPELEDFTPTGTGDPPLSKAVSWVFSTLFLYLLCTIKSCASYFDFYVLMMYIMIRMFVMKCWEEDKEILY